MENFERVDEVDDRRFDAGITRSGAGSVQQEVSVRTQCSISTRAETSCRNTNKISIDNAKSIGLNRMDALLHHISKETLYNHSIVFCFIKKGNKLVS